MGHHFCNMFYPPFPAVYLGSDAPRCFPQWFGYESIPVVKRSFPFLMITFPEPPQIYFNLDIFLDSWSFHVVNPQ